jgi:hypothetical protein
LSGSEYGANDVTELSITFRELNIDEGENIRKRKNIKEGGKW